MNSGNFFYLRGIPCHKAVFRDYGDESIKEWMRAQAAYCCNSNFAKHLHLLFVPDEEDLADECVFPCVQFDTVHFVNK